MPKTKLILNPLADQPLYIHPDGKIYTRFGSNLRRLEMKLLPHTLRLIAG